MKNIIYINLNKGAVFNNGKLFRIYEAIFKLEQVRTYASDYTVLRIYYRVYSPLKQEPVDACDDYNLNEYKVEDQSTYPWM